MTRTIRTLIVLLCLSVILLASLMLVITYRGYWRSDAAYAKLSQQAVVVKKNQPAAGVKETNPAAPSGDVQEPTGEEAALAAETTEPEVDPFPEVDFDTLAAENSHIIAWIYQEDTKINYPVVYSGDNSFYLTHLFNKETNNAGCPFLDKDNKTDFSDRHSIIYGHNMQNGSMFADLLKYRNKDYINDHPDLLLVTKDAKYYFHVFSGYVESGWGNCWKIKFDSDADYQQWLEKSVSRNEIRGEIAEPDLSLPVLTLSTCCYDFDDARYVVLGTLEKAE